MNHCLVTGATGLIGFYLCRQLLQLGYRVTAISRTYSQSLTTFSYNKDFTLLVGNLKDENFTQTIFDAHKMDVVFHLAVERYSPETNKNRDLKIQNQPPFQTNFLGTVNLLQSACNAGVPYWVQSSSMNVYNFENHNYLPVDENHPTAPSESNGLSMLLAEQMCQYFNLSAGLLSVILRYPGVYGPGKNTGIVAKFVQACLSDQKEPLLAFKNRTSDFVYVQDVVDANLLTLQNIEVVKGKILNIGSGVETSVFELANIIKVLTKANVQIHEEAVLKPRRFYFDICKAQKLMNYKPRSIREGLSEFIAELQMKNKESESVDSCK